MPHYELYYFDVRALAEPIRIIFALFDVPHEDHRVTNEQWDELKNDTPYGQLPVLKVDGFEIGQSSAIGRYLARKFAPSESSTSSTSQILYNNSSSSNDINMKQDNHTNNDSFDRNIFQHQHFNRIRSHTDCLQLRARALDTPGRGMLRPHVMEYGTDQRMGVVWRVM
uniref:GST N-terminal domain-containing protein n=2 Tax=Caenorhabditis japonica TaxID=281687 RepID=A0A8R1EEE7_CAEJA